jgi:MFS family permease
MVILYLSEICPRKVRGYLVSGYAFCVTVGLLLAACVNYAVQDLTTSASYRIPIAIQFVWGVVLGGGLLFMPESPRYLIKKGKLQKARMALCRVRGQPADSQLVEMELAEIIANEEYERVLIPAGGWLKGWLNCFSGSLWKSNSNLRKTILGTGVQVSSIRSTSPTLRTRNADCLFEKIKMMQQLTGINFIFYYSTPFLKSTGAIKNPFLISLIFTLVDVCSTPVSFYTVEKFGRRSTLIWGSVGMSVCQFLVAIIGDTVGFNHTHLDAAGNSVANNIPAVNAQIAFIAIYIFFFAASWCGVAWVVVGEVFPLPIRSRGVALSTASNWLWNVSHTIYIHARFLLLETFIATHQLTFILFLLDHHCGCSALHGQPR